MPSFNSVTLVGNLTRDPETRHTQGGTAVTKFGMAMNEKRGDKQVTCFVDVVAFNKAGEVIAKYVSKGDPLLVQGKLSYSAWEAQDGSRRNKLEVVVDQFQFLGGSRRDDADASPRRDNKMPGDVNHGDIPF